MRIRTIASILLTGCATGAAGAPPAPPVDWHAFEVRQTIDAGPQAATAQERAAVEGYAAALSSAGAPAGAPGFAGLGPILDDGAHFAFPGMHDARGRDAVVQAHGALFGAFEARAVAVTRLWLTENAQTFEWTMTGTHERSFEGTPPTHRPVTFRGLTILWTKDDGHVTDVHVYFDVAVVQAQLGAWPGKRPLPAGRAHRTPDLAMVAAVSPIPDRAPPQTFETVEQKGSPDELQNVAVVRSALDALEDDHETPYVQTMTDDVEIVTAERPKPMRGKADALAYFRAIHGSIDQLDTTIDGAWGFRGFAVVEYDIAGDQVGPIGWVPVGEDKVIRLHLVDVVEMRDGKIARITRYDNPAEVRGDE
jgi:ketosteroid isomerase-like protein